MMDLIDLTQKRKECRNAKKMSIETSKLEVELSTNKQTIRAEQGTGVCGLTRSSLMIDIRAKIWDDLRASRKTESITGVYYLHLNI